MGYHRYLIFYICVGQYGLLLKIYVTECPAQNCDQCCGSYMNDSINCEIICICECHNELLYYESKPSCNMEKHEQDLKPN